MRGRVLVSVGLFRSTRCRGSKRLRIGNCFLAAARFKENCFCVGFISLVFYAFWGARQNFFSGL